MKLSNIDIVNDLGAPLAVTAVNIVSRTAMPKYHDTLTYVMAFGPYVASIMGWGNPFLKNVGIAALPLAADKIYTRIKTGGMSRTAGMTRVSRYPASAPEASFQGTRLV